MPIVLNCSADLARRLMTSPRPSYWGNLHAILVKAHDPSAGVYHWPRVAETDEMKGMGAQPTASPNPGSLDPGSRKMGDGQ
ncbi:hypothetical protein KHC23_09560 [Ancylobacter dichloromethanicus]|uniref:Uncharacterized protein n=1 Tax=Ancylobacter dichloromethanicus TaxID=518825 RepID=A0A9W6MYG3_9HYPH|nr:hypothetical protein [Ancylobacter dichloromethanicus]MBS7553899.1 hypothetical protein [Ancylobacter dichloromethanicus]GLK71006.1 hypothetical protein GCM10017643_11210 [Ancylobacter dichloromethanicus]